MFVIRWLLGRIILLINVVFSPSSLRHSEQVAQNLATALEGISLYQYAACPFCVKVRRALKRNGMVLPLVDAKQDDAKQTLVEQGGKLMVPCLRIEKQGDVKWLYESSDIVAFLHQILTDSYRAAGETLPR